MVGAASAPGGTTKCPRPVVSIRIARRPCAGCSSATSGLRRRSSAPTTIGLSCTAPSIRSGSGPAGAHGRTAMPVPRRGRRRLTRAQREHLLLGYCLIPGGYADGADFAEGDVVSMREAWADHRAELLEFWRQDPGAWARAARPGFGTPAPGGPT